MTKLKRINKRRGEVLLCSFCGQDSDAVSYLLKSEKASICDQCLGLGVEIFFQAARESQAVAEAHEKGAA